MLIRIILISLALSPFSILAQGNLLQSGPMLGYAEMREAVVWIQTATPAQVYAVYKDTATGDHWFTDTIFTSSHNASCGKLYFTEVQPGTTYSYRLYVNNQEVKRAYPFRFTTQKDWMYKSDPPAFHMAMGSCSYINEEPYDRPGKPYGSHYEIFSSIAAKKPDAMLWLGDFIYLRPADWTSRTGYIKRYTHTRSLPELQPLLATANNFAIWDDHEFGPNDATGSWKFKDVALEAFKLFWANPSYGYSDLPGIMSHFTYSDMDFFLMDNRYNRTENYEKGEKHIFGKAQCDRLIDQLKASHAPFKFVVSGGQFLNTARIYENHSNYETEHSYLLSRIDEEQIKGVIFITGDRHHSEVMRYTTPSGLVLHEFTVSPLTSGVGKVNETNENLVKGSIIEEHNFAILECSGPLEDRKLEIQFYDSTGDLLYHYSLTSSSIYHEK